MVRVEHECRSEYVRRGVCALLLVAAVSAGVYPSAVEAAGNPITIENQQPGTANWDISDAADDVHQQIKGYASATSVNKGGSIGFQVTVHPAQNYTIDVYRMGWYQGLGGRLMQHIGPLVGAAQTACSRDATTGMVQCNWPVGYTLAVPTTWTTGFYLAKLINAQGYQNYIPFVVRDDSSTADILYQSSFSTFQAYNGYPDDNTTGKSLYEYNSFGAKTIAGTTRAVKVSFDRPYADNGDGRFFENEVYFLQWIEHAGYNITYSTDLDTHEHSERLLNHKAYLSIGHDEYWSKAMYDGVEQARNAGVHLGFFGANEVYWQVRFESSAITGVANRVMACYKDLTIDPVQGPTTTVLWRDSFLNRAEQRLVGVLYFGFFGDSNLSAPFVAANTWHWVYEGTGMADGDSIPKIEGDEVDNQDLSYPIPVSVAGTYTLLSHSPVVTSNGSGFANTSIYQAPSGAWVFAAASITWQKGLGLPGVADPRIQQMTSNVLNRFIGSSSATAPKVAVAAAATPNPVTATSTILSVLGSDDGGEANLTYTWATTGTPPAPVTFSANGTNAAKQVTATFAKAGDYVFQVTITDQQSQSVRSSLIVTVSQTFTGVTVSPPTTVVAPGGIRQFTANAVDQFGAALPSQPAMAWTVTGGGTINSTGLFTAGAVAGGPFTVRASSGGQSGTASVTVSTSAPVAISLVQQATATFAAASSVVVTLPAAPLGGDALVLVAANSEVAVTAVSGGGVTWVKAAGSSSHVATSIWYGLNSSGAGKTITVTFTNAKGSGAVNVSDFFGVATSSALVGAPTPTTGSGTAVATPAITASATVLLVAAAGDTNAAATSAGPTGGFLPLNQAANINRIIPAYQIASTTGSYSAGWTAGNGSWDAAIIGLKAAAGAANPPSAPTNLNAAAMSSTQINLTWTDNANNESGFLIERSLDAVTFNQVATVGANVTSYPDTPLSPSTLYYYRVRASGAGGNSSYCNPSNATTAAPPPLALASVTLNPTSATGGTSSTGTVTLNGLAPVGGTLVTLSSNNAAAQVPVSATVLAGNSSATFGVTTSVVSTTTTATISGAYNGATKTADLTVTPVPSVGLVQQTTATFGAAASVVATLAAAPLAGNALVLFAANSDVDVTAVSGGGVTWVRAARSSSHVAVSVWYGLNSTAGGKTITVTFTNATGSGAINVSEFAGVATANALDGAPTPAAGSGTTVTTPAIVTATANVLLVAAAGHSSTAATTAGPTNGFTGLNQAANVNRIIAAYRIVTATGSYSTGWTAGNDGWDAAIVALKAK